MLKLRHIEDDGTLHVEVTNGLPYVPVVNKSADGELVMANYGPVFTISVMGGGTSCFDVAEEPHNQLRDPQDVYRLTYGKLKVLPVVCQNKSFFITYEDFQTFIEPKMPSGWGVAFNKLAPHVIKLERIVLKD